MMKTYSAKPSDITRVWYVIDGSSAPLGRVATVAAQLLLGKGKPLFTKHIDCGDYVIITNAAKLKVSGKKLTDKYYYRHSQHPGGLKSRSVAEQLTLDPTKVIRAAVKGMLPTNKLRDDRMLRLKVYPNDQHAHEAQKPQTINLGEVNAS